MQNRVAEKRKGVTNAKCFSLLRLLGMEIFSIMVNIGNGWERLHHYVVIDTGWLHFGPKEGPVQSTWCLRGVLEFIPCPNFV